MGLFSSIGSALSSAFNGVCSCVGRICSGIAGALGGTALGSAISGFVSKIGLSIPGVQIVIAIITVANIVSSIAEALGLKEKNKDEPDELAMKAEKDDLGPDDFESTEEYIKHLQEDIQLTKEEKDRLKNMSPEERAAYQATGTYLYAKACSEKLGFDTEGLKNPELVGLTAEVLTDLSKIQNILSPGEFVVYSKYLRANGLGTKEFSDYLHNRSLNLSTDEKVQKAITDAMTEISPNISKDQINQKLYAMNIED
ncbi:MAG: hypothetical protein PUE12_09000 [Oscillospiraceae bacterium]|nr:hypothetical protein [Oscillospiraceae bacterium]